MTFRALPRDIEDRLRAHAAQVIAVAGVPGAQRGDVQEELYGHLVECWQEHRQNGLEAGAAADRAIADFGSAATIGTELGRTYHSRLWASTLGVLLPAVAAPTDRPSAVGWLRFMLGLMLVLNAVAIVSLWSMTPFDLVATAAAIAISTAGLGIGFKAIARRQRWALDYAVWALVVMVGMGLYDAVAALGTGSIFIGVGSILAGLVLLIVRGQWTDLLRFVAGSIPPRGALAVAIVISLLAPLTPRVLAAAPDPTQATADDLDFRMEMACGRKRVETTEGTVLPNAQVATIVMDATWAHTDLLPGGLEHFFSGPDEADTIGMRLNDVQTSWNWTDDDGPTVVDVTSGEPIGTWGSTAQSVNLLPQDVPGTLTVGLEQNELQAEHTVRVTWELYWGGNRNAAWPVVEGYYAHQQRFLLAGSLTCHGVTHGGPIDPASVPPAAGAFPPLPG